MSSHARNKYARAAYHAAIFGMFGALMFSTKMLMELLPNIHLLALFLGAITAVYRTRALIPLYLYIFLDGLIHGFSLWWYPYLYVFLPLFLGFLAIPRRAPRWLKTILYPTVAALHGFAFGLLYAPAQALLFGLDSLEEIMAWVAVGLPFDIAHGISNAVLGTLILPFAALIERLERQILH